MPLASEYAQSNSHLLDDVEDGDEHELGKDHLVTPPGSGLGSGYETAGVGVGEHDHKTRTAEGQQPNDQPTWPSPPFCLDGAGLCRCTRDRRRDAPHVAIGRSPRKHSRATPVVEAV